MLKQYSIFFLIVCTTLVQAQYSHKEDANFKQDSIKNKNVLKSLGNGYLPSKYFNADLRYLIKYNQYEGVRTGLGGVTNNTFSERYKFNGYVVYGFRDHRFKYGIKGGFRFAKKTNSWLNISYINDLQETGSTKFLTDKRFFQFFEPRLLNISLFHEHETKTISLEHQIVPRLETEIEFSSSDISPTYSYSYVLNDDRINSFQLSTVKVGMQWSFSGKNKLVKDAENDYPKLAFQYTKSFNNVLESDFDFSKFDFRAIHKIGNRAGSFSEITIVSGIAKGNVPLTHLYHAYPNNITKEKILQRFSVASLNGFETMYFNEFFSDIFTTFQLKHFIKPFNISIRYKPQLVLITRFAIGDIDDIERHQNVSFSSLKKGYTESGFELNKLLFGFGLSFTYRYGAYHLPEISDNIAVKFTFNISL